MTAQPGTASVTVSVPATSANLGPGYDSLGLALGLRDTVEVTALFGSRGAGVGNIAPAVTVVLDGEGAGSLPVDGSHLIIRSIRETFHELGAPEPESLQLRCHNVIPHGRGLGSSSAAIVAGVVAARTLAGVPNDRDAVVATAARIEGHPDNVAPCVLGGFTIAWTSDPGSSDTGSADTPKVLAGAIGLDVHPEIRAVVAVPTDAVLTQAARGLIPDVVPHIDAAFNVARCALLVDAMTRDPTRLVLATEDRLHQRYRAAAMPTTAALVAALRDDAHAAVVSGAGPSVLVLSTAEVRERVARAAPGWRVEGLPIDSAGATVITHGGPLSGSERSDVLSSVTHTDAVGGRFLRGNGSRE